jgi:hypothetical protein
MAAATTLTAVSIGMGVAQSGASFIQAAKQRKLQDRAQREAKEALLAAKKKLDVNFYDALSIDMTPYERERDALLSAGAQAQQVALEGDERGAGTVAGKLMAAQQAQQAGVSDRQTKQLESLAKLSATEDSRLRDQKVDIDLAEAEGAQQAAADAQAARTQSIQQGFQGLTSAAQTAIQSAPLYGRKLRDPNTQEFVMEDRRGGAEGWRQKLFGPKHRRTPWTADEMAAFYSQGGVNQ